jgi:hypothetical protein
MSGLCRRRAFPACTSALAFFVTASCCGPARAQSAGAPLPLCPLAHVALQGTLDTKIVKSGDVFRFATTAPATLGSQAIPAGTPGAGLIEVMNHSRSGGQSGYLILDARFLSLADGTNVPVAFAPGTDGRSFARIDAGNSDAGLIGYLPYYIGTAAGIYNYFHHGKDAAVLDGTVMPVVLGYGAELGTCSVPTVGPGSAEPAPHF